MTPPMTLSPWPPRWGDLLVANLVHRQAQRLVRAQADLDQLRARQRDQEAALRRETRKRIS
jgi:hypothetical protein